MKRRRSVKWMMSAGIIDLPRLPRMADFAHFGEAVCQGLGHAPGTFLAAYNRNRQAADESALEDSPVARTMKAFVNEGLVMDRYRV